MALLIRDGWCFRNFGLRYLILADSRVNRWYVYGHSSWLSLVLCSHNFCIWFKVSLAHGCHRCLLLSNPPYGSVWVLSLNSGWWGTCLPDFVVFLHNSRLSWALLSTITASIGLRLLVMRRATSDLCSWFPLFNTSLFFFERGVVLWLVKVLEMWIRSKKV